MCGICGVVTFHAGMQVSPEILRSMTDSMFHRGPDGSGMWLSNNAEVGLGHRRLAIVDLSDAGRQPMGNADGSVQVVFNGEIYNFRTLRRQLESKGYHFHSNCDTEVLIYLYEEYDEKMVELLDGDFGFGIWDDRRKRLLLARDRAGVKPVYYTNTGKEFLFASEIKALLKHPSVERKLSEEGLYHYLTFLVVPAPNTLFQGIHKLPAASVLSIDFGNGFPVRREWKYWEPFPGQYDIRLNELDEQLSDLFQRSVEKRLMSDVPLGVLFSGGVDSTLNAASFQSLIHPQKVRTYTVGSAESHPDADERTSARETATRLGSEHHEVSIALDTALDTLDLLAYYQDEPMADPVCIPLYFVSKLARETGTIVLHAGEGADEIFCGYTKYLRFMNYHRRVWKPLGALPSFVHRTGFQLLRMAPSPRLRKTADAFHRLAKHQEFFVSSSIGYYDTEKTTALAPDFLRRFQGCDSFDVVEPLYRRLMEQCPEATFLQKLTFIELQLRLPELLLMRVDKMSMANSLEVRVPFLDRYLTDFALSVPESFKLRKGIPKEPVKRLVSRYVGNDTAYLPKKGFGAPIQEWFRSSLGKRLKEYLESDSDFLGAYLDIPRLLKRIEVGPSTTNEAFQLWIIYNFIAWRRTFWSLTA